MTNSAQRAQTTGPEEPSDEGTQPRYQSIRLVAGVTPLPYPLQTGQTGLLIRRLGVKGLYDVDMAGVLFGTQYYQIALDSLEIQPVGHEDQEDEPG